MKSLEFNPTRFWNLLKVDSVFGHRRFWIAAGAVFGILLTVVLTLAYDRDNDVNFFHETFYPLVLFIGGFLYTSVSFKELYSPQTSFGYLTLPASNLEKFGSKWLLSTLGYVAFSIVFYFIFDVIARWTSGTFFQMQVWAFDPFTENNWLCIRLYLVIQSLFFLGAIAFRKYNALKTIFSLFIFQLGMTVVIYLVARVIWADFFTGWAFTPPDNSVDMEFRPSEGFEEFVIGPLWSTVQFLFWIVLPIILWTVSFFKLKEKEV